MSDRVKGLLITLDQDYREEDIERVISLIYMVKGVIGVNKSVVDHDDYLNRDRIKYEIRKDLFDVLDKRKVK